MDDPIILGPQAASDEEIERFIEELRRELRREERWMWGALAAIVGMILVIIAYCMV